MDFALLLLTSGMLHSHSGIARGRVVWCDSEGLLRSKRRENEAEIRYFCWNLVALWQSNDCWRKEKCIEAKLLLVFDCGVSERV